MSIMAIYLNMLQVPPGTLRTGVRRRQCDHEMRGTHQCLPVGDDGHSGHTVAHDMRLPGHRLPADVRVPRLASAVVAESVHR